LPFAIADADLKADWLSDRRGKKVQVLVPARGPRHDLVELARKNAGRQLRQPAQRARRCGGRLGRLQRRLGPGQTSARDRVLRHFAHPGRRNGRVAGGLRRRPSRTNRAIAPTNPAGREPGRFACMYEVLARRFRRARESAQPGQESWRLPDLLVVDGGKGQLGVALAAARDTASTCGPAQDCPSSPWQRTRHGWAGAGAAHSGRAQGRSFCRGRGSRAAHRR